LTNVYTDGSATNANQDSGAGIANDILTSSIEAANAPTRRHYIKYKVESEAWMMVISLVGGLTIKRAPWLYFSPMCFSVLQTLTKNKLPYLAKSLQLLSNKYRVVLQ